MKSSHTTLNLSCSTLRERCFQTGLPQYYDPLKEEAAKILESIQSELEDTIALELSSYSHVKRDETVSPVEKEETVVRSLLVQLNRTIANALAPKFNHLNEIETDVDPRHEAFWFLGGIYPPNLVRKIKEGVEWQKQYANDPYDRNIQYVGKPYMALRHKLLLEPLLPKDLESFDVKQDGAEIPDYRYDPLALGYIADFRHATTVPGFWPGEQHEFGLLSFQRRSHALNRHKYCAVDDLSEAIDAQGIFVQFRVVVGSGLLPRVLSVQRCNVSANYSDGNNRWQILVVLCLSAQHDSSPLGSS